MRKISMKSFAAESNGGQGKKFPALAVSKLVSFTDSDSRDKSFSPCIKKLLMLKHGGTHIFFHASGASSSYSNKTAKDKTKKSKTCLR